MTLRITTQITGLQGSPYYSTMHFLGDTQTLADGSAAAVEDFWVALRNYIKSGSTIAFAGDVDIINPATGQTTGLLTTASWSTTGLDTGQALPPASQGLVRWRTGQFVGGREVRGRTFIPGATETYSSIGQPDSSYTGAVNTAAAALIADASSFFEVYSRTHHLAYSVTQGSCWSSNYAVLRSRRD